VRFYTENGRFENGRFSFLSRHTRTFPVFAPQPQSVIALWLVLHCPYPRRDSQVELTWVAGYIPKEIPHCAPRKLNPDNTNRTRRRLTSLIETNVLPLCQTVSSGYSCLQTSAMCWTLVMLRLILNILSMNLCYAVMTMSWPSPWLVSFMSNCLSPSQRMKLLARCINAQPVYELFIAVFCPAGDHKSLVRTFVVYSMSAQSLNTARLVSHAVKNVHWTNWKKFSDVSRRE